MTIRGKAAGRLLWVATLVLAAIARAEAGATSIVLRSDPGDYIGQGQTLAFTAADGAFQAYGSPADVTVLFSGQGHWWNLQFRTADGQPLAVGPYENAVRYFQGGAGQPGLDVYGDGRGCSMVSGRFDVHEVVFGGASEVVSFWATFEQHCEGAGPALRGEVRFNANVPLQLSGPTVLTVQEHQTVAFTVEAIDVQGRHVALTATVPAGASFVDNGQNAAAFSWTPLPSQVGKHVVVVQGTNGVNIETLWVTITVTPTPPANDEIEGATVIPFVPFTLTQETTTATAALDDPYCGGGAATVWFSFTPVEARRIEFNTTGSSFFASLSAYTGSRGNLTRLACSEGYGSRIRFDVVAGVTYYVMVGALPWNVPVGGSLQLNVAEAPPPFTTEFTVTPFSLVEPSTGEVTVMGTVTCSSQSFVFIYGLIRQERAGRVANAYFGAYVPCDGTTPFAAPATYTSTPALFHGRGAMLFTGGKADVTADAQAYDPVEGTFVFRHLTAVVQLRGSRSQ